MKPISPGSTMPLTESPLAAGRMDEDLAQLLNLGLKLKDVERLWENVPGMEPVLLQASAERLLQGKSETGTVKMQRQASLGIELLSTASSKEVIDDVARRLLEELEEPPDEFKVPGATLLHPSLPCPLACARTDRVRRLDPSRYDWQDPIMLGLMKEPVVLSSGHCFDHSTVYDELGRLRFERCPITREPIERRAYPLMFLKAQIVDFQLRRLGQVRDELAPGTRDERALCARVESDTPARPAAHAWPQSRRSAAALLSLARQVLQVVSSGHSVASLDSLLGVAKNLLSTLGAGKYQKEAFNYFRFRREAVARAHGAGEDRPDEGESGRVGDGSVGTPERSSGAQSRVPALLVELMESIVTAGMADLAPMLDEIASEFAESLSRLWADGRDARQAEEAAALIDASITPLEKPPTKGWVPGWIALIRRLPTHSEGVTTYRKCAALAPVLARLPPPSPVVDQEGASAYWAAVSAERGPVHTPPSHVRQSASLG